MSIINRLRTLWFISGLDWKVPEMRPFFKRDATIVEPNPIELL